MIFLVDLLLMLIDLTCSIVNAVVQTFLRPRLKCVDGELCLITGAGGALGRLFALEFAKEGARLVLWDCDEAANELTASLAREQGAQVHAYTVDLSKRHGIYEAAERVRAEVGDVSMLVNNAGVVAGRRLLDCPDELLERTLLVNCHALFWVSTWRTARVFYARVGGGCFYHLLLFLKGEHIKQTYLATAPLSQHNTNMCVSLPIT